MPKWWAIAALSLTTLPAHPAPLFESNEPLTVTLAGPVSRVVNDSSPAPEERPFSLTLEDGTTLPVAVRARGNFRRRECQFAPLRLNFDPAGTRSTPFAGQNKLKLVTHCKSGKAYQTNTLQEYLAYRILNLVTDVSFRVRLLNVTYADTSRSREISRWAFVIEDTDALARRVDGEHVEPPHVSPTALEAAHATRVALFQYLISNTDYSPVAALKGRSCCHNMKLIRAGEALYSVPYDFDMSGLVNAHYAGPNPVVDHKNVRRRIYRGYCTTDPAVLAAAIEQFARLREPILGLPATTPGLESGQAERDRRYLEGFFDELDRNDVTARLGRKCLPTSS